MVEDARRRLRPLVALISKGSRDPLYTDFTDELGEAVEVDLPRGAVDDFHAVHEALM